MSEQLSLFSAIETDSQNVSIARNASETKRLKHQALQRFLDTGDKESIPHVNTYKVKRTKNLYYRLSYRVGRRMKHLHIPGGNTRSEIANYRAGKINELIDRGADLDEVIALVQTYRSRGSK